MTSDLKLTVYGLATHADYETHCVLFDGQDKRIGYTLELADHVSASEAEITIDLATVPAVAAMTECLSQSEKLLSEMVEYYDYDLSESGIDGEGGSPAKRCRQFLEQAAAKSDLEVRS